MILLYGELSTIHNVSTAPDIRKQQSLEKLNALTGIRYIAAALVVFHHLAPRTSGHLNHFLSTIGYGAVSLFFILSGFVLVYSNVGDNGLKKTAKQFWVARFARIYPLYFLAYLVAAPYVIHSALTNHPGLIAGPGRILVYSIAVLLAVQSWLPPIANAWNGPAWSLSAEAFFYGFFPKGVTLLRRLGTRGLLLFLVACWIVSLLPPFLHGHFSPFFLNGRLRDDHPWVTAFVLFFPPLRLPEFLAGMALGLLHQRSKKANTTPSGLTVTFVEVATLLCLGMIVFVSATSPHYLYRACSFPSLCGLIYCLSQNYTRVSRLLGCAPMVHLGAASYAVYIFHIPLAAYYRTVLQQPMEGVYRTWGEVWCYLAFTTAVSWLLHRFVETPAADFINARYGGRGNASREADLVASGSR